MFNEYFDFRGLATEPTDFDGRSDYGPFIASGIPSGGLFSGAEGVKTPQQAAIYGGAAGSWYDPCYHQACDTLNTILGQPPLDADGLEEPGDAALMQGNGRIGFHQLADAAAHATWYLATRANPLGTPGTLAARTRAARRTAAKSGTGFAYRGHQRVQR